MCSSNEIVGVTFVGIGRCVRKVLLLVLMTGTVTMLWSIVTIALLAFFAPCAPSNYSALFYLRCEHFHVAEGETFGVVEKLAFTLLETAMVSTDVTSISVIIGLVVYPICVVETWLRFAIRTVKRGLFGSK
jgi:hypothetical protein